MSPSAAKNNHMPRRNPPSNLFARISHAVRGEAKHLGGSAMLGILGRDSMPSQRESFTGAVHDRHDPTDPTDPIDELSEHSITLAPITKRRIYQDLQGVPEGLSLGWAQLQSTHGTSFSLGIFAAHDKFSQIALADDHGRVFAGTDPSMDTHGVEPRVLFTKEGGAAFADAARLGSVRFAGARAGSGDRTAIRKTLRRMLGGRVVRRIAVRMDPGLFSPGVDEPEGRTNAVPASGRETETGKPAPVAVIQGGVIGRDESGRMTWLASWLKHGNRYVLEQLRTKVPGHLREDLEYRDAIAVGFFAAYLLPQIHGLLIGFGSGNIFRRLNREAPMGAIRRAVQDTLQAKDHDLRTSGLEDYFADLMQEAGTLEPTPGLEAVHGAEPLHLYTSSYSGSYFFTWQPSLAFAPALKSLKIEGNLNRFAGVSSWLEYNARAGLEPVEDNVTRMQAAQIDLDLLKNPALLALRSPLAAGEETNLPHRLDDANAVMGMVEQARNEAKSLERQHPDPVGAVRTGTTPNRHTSEWLFRQTMATLLRRLRLPYRFDVEFRSDVADGRAAIGFTTAGTSMMPSRRYDTSTHQWIELGDDERSGMSAQYNLRIGLMMAALAFGAEKGIDRVSLHIDSIGLEEAVAQQDSAITELMSQALGAFERIRTADIGYSGSKADPKDGDVHGDPSRGSRITSSSSQSGSGSPASSRPDDNDHDEDDGDSSDSTAVSGAEQNRADDRSGDEGVADSTDSGDSDGRANPSADSGLNAQGDQGDDDRSDRTDDRSDHAEGDSGKGGPESAVDQRFEDLMKDVDIDEMAFRVPGTNRSPSDEHGSDSGSGSWTHSPQSSDDASNDAEEDDPQQDPDDPLQILQRNPTVRNMVTVSFTRRELLARLADVGLRNPVETYRMFDAEMDMQPGSGFKPVTEQFDLHDPRFSPEDSQQEPEYSHMRFTNGVRQVLGAGNAMQLSIQRDDLLKRAVTDFHRIAADTSLESVAKAQEAMHIVERIGDPELTDLSSQVSSALIDGHDTPELQFALSKELDAQRVKARNLLFAGQTDQAIQMMQSELARLDALYAGSKGVPRYFNSYAERVVYNRLFATDDELTVLIPDNLFYAHMEMADLLAQLKGAKASLAHLNAMVSYAPAYPLSHMKLAVQLALNEDWDSARAACLNALRVALDRDDAAFAYYRLAYAAWMRDEFDVAAAAYLMSGHIGPGQIGALDGELRELMARAQSQCLRVPQNVGEAARVLEAHGLPVWPHTEVAGIVRDAARVCVDQGMFVPARTLSVAAARMNDGEGDGIDMAQAQFLRSLNR